MPILLHEAQGLKIVKNDANSFIICTLHHTADPAKRETRWRREASAGMSPEKFAREYDIDYNATMGAKVFPQITSCRSEIVISDPLPDFGPHVKYWGGFDYGIRNPTSFHVYTIVDGIIYAVWELYRPAPNIPEFVAHMKEFPYWHSIRHIAADPALWATTQQQTNGNPISVQDLFYKAGVRNMIKGINSQEDAWITQITAHWQDQENITFKILAKCPNLIREFETAVYTNQSERQLLTQSYQERIADIDNHALDDCKYFMLSQPSPQIHRSWADINLNRWGNSPSGTSTQAPGPSLQSSHPVRGYY